MTLLVISIVLPLGALQGLLVPPAAQGAEETAWARVQRAHQATGTAAPIPPPFLALSAGELREAAQQAAVEARSQNPEAALQAFENIALCLEYYPVSAQEEESLLELFAQTEQPMLDPWYRLYLVQRLVPGLVPASLFGDYLQEGARKDYYNLRTRLGRLSNNPREDAEIRAAAMEAFYLLLWNRLGEILAEVPALRQHQQPDGRVDPGLLKVSNIRLDTRSARGLAQSQQDFVNAAKVYARAFNPPGQPESVETKARELLQRIVDNVPLPNPEEVRALIPEETPS
jgi:hypothetical protein